MRSLYASKQVFDNERMEYRQTDGKTRRVHKQYVDVVARILAGGEVVPVSVCWVDGRTFTIDEVLHAGSFGIVVQGVRTATYSVRFGGHETEIYLEERADVREAGTGARAAHALRWWVWAFDCTLEAPRRG